MTREERINIVLAAAVADEDREFDRILNMSDAEIKAELRADGIDPDEAAARILARVNERLTAKSLPKIGGPSGGGPEAPRDHRDKEHEELKSKSVDEERLVTVTCK